MSSGVGEALDALRRGIPVLVYDDAGRENEVDYVVHASRVDADTVYEMRRLAGGLICYAMPLHVAHVLGIEFMTETYSRHPRLSKLVTKPRYGDMPAFSVWVNHVDVTTGIRDSDRALTIRALDKVTMYVYEGMGDLARRIFYDEFMAPGHVPILIGRSISERRGHTELSLHLSALADLRPSVVLVEMLDRGTALSLEDAKKISKEYGYPLVSTKEVIEAVQENRDKLCTRYKLC